MKLPPDALIAPAKLHSYLLAPLKRSDKSKWLSNAGYQRGEWQRLRDDIRDHLLPLDATPIESTRFGIKYEIRGQLRGPSGVTLAVRSFWMREYETGVTKFVTLYRDTERDGK